MIQPKYILYHVCPDCAAPYCQFGRNADKTIHTHVNGGFWEYIVFTCGRKDEFIPNFNQIQMQSPCSNTPEMRDRKQKRQDAITKLRKFVRDIDVDDAFRERIARNYSYLESID